MSAIWTTNNNNIHIQWTLSSYGSQIGEYLWLACLIILSVYLFCKVHMALGATIATPVIHTSVASPITTPTIQPPDSIHHHLLTSDIIVVVILWIIGKCIYLCTLRNKGNKLKWLFCLCTHTQITPRYKSVYISFPSVLNNYFFKLQKFPANCLPDPTLQFDSLVQLQIPWRNDIQHIMNCPELIMKVQDIVAEVQH